MSNFYQMEFSDFNWVEIAEAQAIYSGKKFNDVPDGIRDASIPLQSIVESKAVRLWHRHQVAKLDFM